MNRRQALKSTAAVTAASMIHPLLFGEQASREFRIGASDWSFSRMLEPECFQVDVATLFNS